MIILPAIDLYGGKAVRLFKGDYQQMTVYNDNPVMVAKDFVAKGQATFLVRGLGYAHFYFWRFL